MITQQLLEYIKQSLERGKSPEDIKNALLANGWKEEDVNEGCNQVMGTASASQSTPESQPPVEPTEPIQESSALEENQIITSDFDPTPQTSKKKYILIGAICIFGVLTLGASAYFLAPKLLKPKPTPTPSQTPFTEIIPTPSNSVSTNTTCDNYQCLISAASQCQPISVTISYSDVPFPLDPNISMSGQTYYEIKKSSGANDCLFSFSSPVTIFSISDKGQKNALAKGITNAQITAQLQTMNDSLKSTAGTKTTCRSNASIISDYLKDLGSGNAKTEAHITMEQTTITYTASTGQKLICTTQ